MQNAETVLDVLRDRAANHDHDIVTGEPGDRKRSRRVREGGVGKGPARAPRRRRTSAACHPGAIERRWTRERVLEAMRDWRARYGRLPSSYDWSRTHARRRGGEALERLSEGELAVGERRQPAVCGSWLAARSAVGDAASSTARRLRPTDDGTTFGHRAHFCAQSPVIRRDIRGSGGGATVGKNAAVCRYFLLAGRGCARYSGR